MKPLSEQCSEHQKKSAGEMPSEEAARTAPGNGVNVNAAPTREVLTNTNKRELLFYKSVFDVI